MAMSCWCPLRCHDKWKSMFVQREKCSRHARRQLPCGPCGRMDRRSSMNTANFKPSSKTFCLWPDSAENMIRKEEDRKFLESMKTDRVATFGCFDAKLSRQARLKENRIQNQERLRENCQKELTTQVELEASTDEDDSETVASSLDTSPKDNRPHMRKKTGISAFIPPDIMQSKRLVSLASRIKMTPAQQAAYTAAFVEEVATDSSKVNLSYSSAARSRRTVSETIATNIKESWNPPRFASLHWDSKLMPSLKNQNEKQERLVVAVGNSQEIKVLGIPYYAQGTNRKSGEIICELTKDLLEKWKCADSIVNLVFDTTASNTGHVSAACVSIQQFLQRPLLWSGCRHHIGELVVSQVFNDLKIETSKSPDVTLFLSLRKNWEELMNFDLDSIQGLKLETFSGEALQLVLSLKAETLKTISEKKTWKRDDYKEFCELCAVFLSGDLSSISLKRPGALHKARWMAKIIYLVKICLLQDRIQMLPKKSTITTKLQVKKIYDSVLFFTLLYCKWWLSCESAVDAPHDDLQFAKAILQYKLINANISKSAFKAFNRHKWYLTPEMIPLSLFSDVVSNNQKRAIADALTAVKPRHVVTAPKSRFGTGFGKPFFPEEISPTTQLADLVTEDSWFLFYVLELDPNFLSLEVNDWPTSHAFCKSLNNTGALNVVNDCAERGVKMGSDYLQSAKNEQCYQIAIQVVEGDRKTRPNLRKRKMSVE